MDWIMYIIVVDTDPAYVTEHAKHSHPNAVSLLTSASCNCFHFQWMILNSISDSRLLFILLSHPTSSPNSFIPTQQLAHTHGLIPKSLSFVLETNESAICTMHILAARARFELMLCAEIRTISLFTYGMALIPRKDNNSNNV